MAVASFLPHIDPLTKSIIIGGVGMAVFFILFLRTVYKHSKQREAEQIRAPIEITYLEGIEIGRRLLEDYAGSGRALWRPYAESPEFGYKGSIETLSKAFSVRQPYQNPKLVQKVLNDLAPGKYLLIQERKTA